MWYYALKVRGEDRFYASPHTFVDRRSAARQFHDEQTAKEAAQVAALPCSVVVLNTAGDR